VLENEGMPIVAEWKWNVVCIDAMSDNAMMLKIKSLAVSLLNGTLSNSPSFVSRTGFKSAAHFRRHIASTLPANLKLSDHGTKWHIDHIIPQQAYDFGNSEDIKKCWSPANVRGIPPKQNNEKKWKIIDELCEGVGYANYPATWGGCIPNDQEKQELYKVWMTAFELREA
jgi:hypothetical protein